MLTFLLLFLLLFTRPSPRLLYFKFLAERLRLDLSSFFSLKFHHLALLERLHDWLPVLPRLGDHWFGLRGRSPIWGRLHTLLHFCVYANSRLLKPFLVLKTSLDFVSHQGLVLQTLLENELWVWAPGGRGILSLLSFWLRGSLQGSLHFVREKRLLIVLILIYDHILVGS